jgi:thiol-disulfide isomerase/thioredoxin
MSHSKHQIVRRGLLAAAGTLLAAAAARKYLFAPSAGAGDSAGPLSVGPPPAGPPPAGPVPQPITVLEARPPASVPGLRFTTADGTARSLADYAGKGVVLNFWATWCVPCVSEMPALDSLARAVAQEGIVVLPVSLDRTGAAAVGPFYAAHGIRDLPVLLDPHSDTMTALKLDGIPTTLVIDRHGREVSRVQGPVQWDSDRAAAVLGGLVG